MLDWKIFYADGSCFDSEQGTPQEAPGLGVLVVVNKSDEVGRFLVQGQPYYWFKDKEWFAGDVAGLYDYLLTTNRLEVGPTFHKWDGKTVDIFGLFEEVIKAGLIKFGRTVGNKEFHKVVMRAAYDTGFAPKSAKLQYREG